MISRRSRRENCSWRLGKIGRLILISILATAFSGWSRPVNGLMKKEVGCASAVLPVRARQRRPRLHIETSLTTSDRPVGRSTAAAGEGYELSRSTWGSRFAAPGPDLSFCGQGHGQGGGLLARGLPMAKAPGEPMRREDGLSCGQGCCFLFCVGRHEYLLKDIGRKEVSIGSRLQKAGYSPMVWNRTRGEANR